jgi:transposase-like protein
MGSRKNIDWEAIEREYSNGQKSIRAIANQYGVVHTSISRRARKEGWVQDKQDEVRRRTKAKLLTSARDKSTKTRTKSTNPTQEDINLAVHTNIEVLLGHRSHILQARQAVGLLMTQLQDAAVSRERLHKLIAKSDESPQAKAGMRKAVNLPAHAGVVRDLSTALKNLITLERQAFNLDEPGAVLEDVLAALPGHFRDRVREALTTSVS